MVTMDTLHHQPVANQFKYLSRFLFIYSIMVVLDSKYVIFSLFMQVHQVSVVLMIGSFQQMFNKYLIISAASLFFPSYCASSVNTLYLLYYLSQSNRAS